MEAKLVYTVRILNRVQETRLKLTYHHSQRVASYAIMLARELGMPTKEQQYIYLAGLLHDIGKLGVSNAILFKPGKLTEDEWEEIKEHPVISYEILSVMPCMKVISLMALYHHERYDGYGYPEGLQGEAIPLGARILAVADSFDAMTSRRVYRPMMSRESALEELYRCKGTQFDPYLVEVFCRAVERGEIDGCKHSQMIEKVMGIAQR
ncbi:HD-GYP domain-containing protein [Desulfofundulus sp.]|uniref:HD-GYP domain-containing protein n=1 Tax=Desulfofundulus sp. TaxID=2282750 RepID=UPI003C77FCFF